MIGLPILVFLVSIPVAIGFALTRLIAGRRGVPGPAPFRNCLYSGLKRMACAWGVELAVCVLAFVVLGSWDYGFIPHAAHFLCLAGAALLSFAWGVAWPRTYADGIDRVKSGRRLAWGLLAFYLFFVLCLVFMAVNIVAGIGFGGHIHPREFAIKSPVFVAGKFRVAGPITYKLIPPQATDIDFTYRHGLGGRLGASAELHCRVERDDLLTFASDNGYVFRPDSYQFNACADGPQNCDFIRQLWGKYNPSEEKLFNCPKDPSRVANFKVAPDWMPFSVGGKPYPKEFLAYNHRRASCGGCSFFYDVQAKILYASWDSN